MMSIVPEFVYEGADCCRLDRFLVNALAAEPDLTELSRSQIKQRIEEGAVLVNGGVTTKAGHALKNGDVVRVDIPPAVTGELEPFDFPLKIIFEDQALLVIDKPPGLSMHPGAGNPNKSALNALIGHFGRESAGFPDHGRLGVVHRLDKDTSGVVVVAKTPGALAALSSQFSQRTVSKSYTALVFVTPRGRRVVQIQESGRIEAPLGRHPKRRTLMAVVDDGGRPAITCWRRLESSPPRAKGVA